MPPTPNGGGAERPPSSKPQSPLRITHDGEFYARLLTKESSLGNPSFRYYGAGPGAVPFVWESQPGTPKDAYSSRMLAGVVSPAITPPPAYHLRGAPHGHSVRRHGKSGRGAGGRVKYCGCKLNKWIKIGFIATVFRRLAFGKSRSSPSASSAKSSSTRWLFSGSNVAEARDEVYCYEPAPPTKGVLCLGVRPTPRMCSSGAVGGGRARLGVRLAPIGRPVTVERSICAPSVQSASMHPVVGSP